MKHNWKNEFHSLLLIAGTALTMAACNSIDDDLGDCGRDVTVVYTVRQLCNLDTRLASELTTPEELPLISTLRQALEPYFSQQAHELDFTFFTPDGTAALQERHTVDARQTTFTSYLKDNNYRNIATANSTGALADVLSGLSLPGTYTLQQATGADTIGSHNSGLFTARTSILVDNTTQGSTALVNLYQQNSAVALVLDPQGTAFPAVRACITGLASSFAAADSTYGFSHSAPLRMEPLATPATSPLLCLVGRGFPSADTAPAATRAAGDPATAADALWQVHIYVSCPDGSVTETRFFMPSALQADQLHIVKGVILPDGTVVPSLHEVGVSVTLDWNPGGTYTPTL